MTVEGWPALLVMVTLYAKVVMMLCKLVWCETMVNVVLCQSSSSWDSRMRLRCDDDVGVTVDQPGRNVRLFADGEVQQCPNKAQGESSLQVFLFYVAS